MGRLLESLADLEHQQWSHWTQYYLDVSGFQGEEADRWTRQMNTPYSNLSSTEMEKDRKYARRAKECFFAHRDNIRLGTRAVVRCGHEYLLISFKWDDRVCYELPGGGVYFDESPKECIMREVYEETGLVCSAGQYMGTIGYSFPEEAKYEGFLGWLFLIEVRDTAFTPYEDIVCWEWVDWDRLRRELPYYNLPEIEPGLIVVPESTSTDTTSVDTTLDTSVID